MYRYIKRTALWFKKLSAASEAKLLTGIAEGSEDAGAVQEDSRDALRRHWGYRE
jgi:hypothetical protein